MNKILLAKVIVLVMALVPWSIVAYLIKKSDTTVLMATLICIVASFMTGWMLSYYPEPPKKKKI